MKISMIMLNVYVNKLLWMPHKNIVTQKIFQVEITVHVLPTKQLLATYSYLFILLYTETAKCSQIRTVCYPL